MAKIKTNATQTDVITHQLPCLKIIIFEFELNKLKD